MCTDDQRKFASSQYVFYRLTCQNNRLIDLPVKTTSKLDLPVKTTGKYYYKQMNKLSLDESREQILFQSMP